MKKEIKEYDPETLAKLQELELEILKDFNHICDKYDIDYFACGGTCIGVARHHGFIPWDDDIDVGLSRKDMLKFYKVAEKEFPGKYTLLNADTDPNYYCMNTKWMLNGTEFREYGNEYYPRNLGIFLDMFCFDNVPDDDKLMRKQGFWAWFWGKLLILRNVSKPTLYVYGIKAKIVTLISMIAHFFLVLFHVSPRFLYKKAQKHARMYDNTETKRMAFLFDPQPYTSMVVKKTVYPTVKRKYDTTIMRSPCKMHAYLSRRYGDYMKLPPVEKRHNHLPYKLDFGNYQ